MWQKIPDQTKRIGLVCLIYAAIVSMLWLLLAQKLYLWLIWNLCLAAIPLLISSAITAAQKKKPTITIPLLAIWLLFLPNAFYVITDLVHLSKLNFYTINQTTFTAIYHENISAYLLLFAIFTGAILALTLGLKSIADMHQLMIQQKWSRPKRAGTLTTIFGLTGYGMYIGRFLRLNSWDIFLNPLNLLNKTTQNFDIFTLEATILFTLYVASAYWFYLKIFTKNGSSRPISPSNTKKP